MFYNQPVVPRNEKGSKAMHFSAGFTSFSDAE
jgi:hypothetical protein